MNSVHQLKRSFRRFKHRHRGEFIELIMPILDDINSKYQIGFSLKRAMISMSKAGGSESFKKCNEKEELDYYAAYVGRNSRPIERVGLYDNSSGMSILVDRKYI